MPVQDFALDAQNNRIQVHWSFEDGPVSVMLNRSVIGTIATREERMTGKDITLPDNSVLHVQFSDNRPQVFRNGYLLTPVEQTAAEPLSPKKRGGCLTTWITLNLVVISIFTLIYFLAIFGTTHTAITSINPVEFLVYGLPGLHWYHWFSIAAALEKMGILPCCTVRHWQYSLSISIWPDKL